jgi:hypothetical protein
MGVSDGFGSHAPAGSLAQAVVEAEFAGDFGDVAVLLG